MRARYADIEGHVERDGVKLGFEIYENNGPTILLLPTWTIIHSRFWKMQVPYLARHFRVVTYDGPGNGKTDRVTDSSRYATDSYARDAVAVMDASETKRAIVVGLSLGSAYATRLARLAPERLEGVIMIGPSLPLTEPSPERASSESNFTEPYPDDVSGWGKYNLAYWQDHYDAFTRFFLAQCFPEMHSTKQREDGVGWASETNAEVLGAEAMKPPADEAWSDAVAAIECPVLVVHGTEDRISPHDVGVEAARLSGGTLLSMEGSGHLPMARNPVRVNLAIKAFVDRVAS